MDDNQRKLRIERMNREKARQLRRRKRRRALLLRGGLVLAVILVLVLLVTGVRSVLHRSSSSDQTVAEVQESGDNEETVEVTVEADAEETAEVTGVASGEASEVTVEPTAVEETVDEASEEESEDALAIAALPGGTEASTLAISDTTEVNYAVPGWQVNDSGWWYATADHTYYASGWKIIDDQNYYFDESGMMQTGWKAIGNTGCYFNEAGEYEPDKESKMVALTFDDGPGPYTSELLDTLEQYGAKATFFQLGEQVEQYGEELLPRMVALGCQIGNHSYNHPNLKELSESEITEQFTKTDELINQYSGGYTPTVARTPYGSQDETITNLIGKPCIFWSLDTLDWETKDVASNISAVMDHVSDGEIILMHDIWSTTVESIKTIVPQLIEQGYELVTIDEIAEAKGVEMQNGVTYYDFYNAEEATAGGADESESDSTEETETDTSEETTDDTSDDDSSDDSEEEIYDDYEEE